MGALARKEKEPLLYATTERAAQHFTIHALHTGIEANDLNAGVEDAPFCRTPNLDSLENTGDFRSDATGFFKGTSSDTTTS